MIRILYAGSDEQRDAYQTHLGKQLADMGINADISTTTDDPAGVDYILYAPSGPIRDLSPFANAKLVQSLWAGVETIIANETLTQPLARMVEGGMSQGMADYVMGHILRHHLGTDHFTNAKAGNWDENRIPPLASERRVCFLGLGELGMYCAAKAAEFGFNVCGWSRSAKSHPLVECFSGADGLTHALAQADIVVLLLPDTAATENTLNAETLAAMKPGASIINPGRGPLIDDDALITALDSGQISQATLDVFRVEPLPADHPYWAHPKVLVTPHIASATRVNSAVEMVAENIARGEAGKPFLHLVDRGAGY